MCKEKHQGPGRADREGLSVIELFKMFPDNASARKWMEDLRWGEGERHCPVCGSVNTKTVPNEKPMKKALIILALSLFLALNCSAQVAPKSQDTTTANIASESPKDTSKTPPKALDGRVERTEPPAKQHKTKDANRDKKFKHKTPSLFSISDLIALGLGFIAITISICGLNQNRRSNQSQNRAYVHASDAIFSDDRLGFRVIIEAMNTGQTPAIWWETASICGVYEPSDDCNLEQFVDFNKVTEFRRWPALAAGEDLTAGLGAPEDESCIKKATTTRSRCFYIYGIIRYKTMFNEIFETQFVFFHPEPKHESSLIRPNYPVKAFEPKKKSSV